jgi:hypothetical protein
LFSVAALTIGCLLLFCPASAHAQGGVPLWTNVSSGGAFDLAVDNSGNVFVAGISYNGSNSDYQTVKYSSAGVPLWTNRYNGPANLYDSAGAIAVDASGNVFVTGQSFESNDTSSARTLAYSNAGVPLWTNSYGYGGLAIAVDSRGNVFVTGVSFDGGGLGSFGTYAIADFIPALKRRAVFVHPSGMIAATTATATASESLSADRHRFRSGSPAAVSLNRQT